MGRAGSSRGPWWGTCPLALPVSGGRPHSSACCPFLGVPRAPLRPPPPAPLAFSLLGSDLLLPLVCKVT